MGRLTEAIKRYEYDNWAMRRAIAGLEEMDPPGMDAMKQAAHIFLSPIAWMTRMKQGHSNDIDIWPDVPEGTEGIALLRDLHSQSKTMLNELYARLTDEMLDERVEYTSYEGNKHIRTIGEILQHISNHGSYHRGYINVYMKRDGGKPVNSDYVAFCEDDAG